MEQFQVTNAELNELVDLNEEDLVQVSGGISVSKVVGGVGRFARDNAAIFGVVEVVNPYLPRSVQKIVG